MRHTCHIPRCVAACPPRYLMCPPHWKLVPTDIQNEVYRTVTLRGPRCDKTWAPWWRAQAKAVHAAMVKEGRDKEACDRWLTKELDFADRIDT